jgi:CO/xanthine dehydrogenase Mo-binding subunit
MNGTRRPIGAHSYGSYGWACDVIEVEVDRDTWAVRPIKLTTVHEIGKAIHPMLVAGQIEGGTAQGLAWALLEDVVMRDGRMANHTLTNYIVPTTLDTPDMDVAVLERPYKHGPFGAKGVGALPIEGPAPAVVNALRHAASIFAIPALGKLMTCSSLNGKRVRVDAPPLTRLLDVLREGIT